MSSRSDTTLTGIPVLIRSVPWVCLMLESDAWHSGSDGDPFEALGDRMRVDGRFCFRPLDLRIECLTAYADVGMVGLGPEQLSVFSSR